MRKFDRRELSREAERTRSFFTDVALSTGGATSVPLFRAGYDCKVQRIAFLPRASFSASSSNYWTFALGVYGADGDKARTLPNTTMSLSVISFTVGRPVVQPSFGRVDGLVEAGESVWAVVSETGTANDVAVRVQVDVTRR